MSTEHETIEQAQAQLSSESERPPVRIERLFTPHASRAAVINEVHTRPFQPVATPARVFHLAFMAESGAHRADQAHLAAFLADRGLPPMPDGARHYRFRLPGMSVRWESHTEFTTYGFTVDEVSEQPFTAPLPNIVTELLSDVPGSLIVAVRLSLRTAENRSDFAGIFEPASLCVSEVMDGQALLATDLKPDAGGFTRYYIENRGLGSVEAGTLVQRVLEIETYRTLALLGLPKAQYAAPKVRAIEEGLADVTEEMRAVSELGGNRALLDRLTGLAGEVEAIAASTSYRFSASQAYEQIVESRLKTLGEEASGGQVTLGQFLMRRMMPAMRTCQSVEQRLSGLAEKLARTASLLRARVDVELESQNRDLLHAMNRRAKLQLRLQQTVEGLSVAAVSYYVVGLISYLAKGASDLGMVVKPGVVAAISVPIVIVAIGLLVRRIRRSHTDNGPL